MSDIEIGSVWTANGYSHLDKVVVLAIVRDTEGETRVAIENVWNDGTSTFVTPRIERFEANHTPYRPFFEVDTLYRLKDMAMAKVRWHVTDVRELDGKLFAIAIRVDGASVRTLVVLNSIENFEEA